MSTHYWPTQQVSTIIEIVEMELQLHNPNDAVCILPIPLPHMHSGCLCLSGENFMVAVLMIIGVRDAFVQHVIDGSRFWLD